MGIPPQLGSKTSLTTASLSDPSCICAPLQSLGVQDEERCWLCDLDMPWGGKWDVEQAETLSLPTSKSIFYICRCVFLLPQVFFFFKPLNYSVRSGFLNVQFEVGIHFQKDLRRWGGHPWERAVRGVGWGQGKLSKDVVSSGEQPQPDPKGNSGV